MKKISLTKIVSALTASVLLTVSAGSVPAKDTAVALNTDRVYDVYDAETGEWLRDYVLFSDYYSGTSSRGVIGSEDRYQDFSKTGTVKLILNSTGYGSGFVVDEHTIATAAHCVDGHKISDIKLFDTEGNNVLNATPVEFHVPFDYVSPPNGRHRNCYDYALITVEEDLSDYMCFNLGVVMDSFMSSNTAVKVSGFSSDRAGYPNTSTIHNCLTAEGTVVDITDDTPDYTIRYDADVMGGSSGGPVYITETRCGKTYYTVVGVNTTSGSTYNFGTRMTTDLYRFYLCNPNLNWE